MNKNWVLVLFSLPFVGIGGRTGYESVHALLSNPPEMVPILLFWPFGVVFSTVGWGLLLFGIFGKTVQPGTESPLAARKRQLGILAPAEQWAAGRISTDGRWAMIIPWFKALSLGVLLGPVIWVGWHHGVLHAQPVYLPWCLATLIPFSWALKAIYKTLQWRKYGSSICEIQRKPGLAGGEFRFLIRPESTILPAGEAIVEMRCEKREKIGSGKSQQLKITVLWKDSQRIALTVPGLGIPGTFILPPGLPDANHDMKTGVFWILDARSTTDGINYAVSFDLAVKRT